MTQANSTFYNLVIPKLYETITITETNMFKLKYGCGGTDVSCPSPGSETTAYLPTGPSSIVDGEFITTEDPWTRKDRAVGHCLRLIIDVPLYSATHSLQCLVDRLPHHRFGNVEEMVFTQRGLSDRVYDMQGARLSSILPQLGRTKSGNDPLVSTPKLKRVVIHLDSLNQPELNRYLASNFNRWCHTRSEEGRTQPQFVL